MDTVLPGGGVTPAKPPSKKGAEKGNGKEENDKTTGLGRQTIMQPLQPPALPPNAFQPQSQPQTLHHYFTDMPGFSSPITSAPGNIVEEIGAMKSIFATVLSKLDKLDIMERTIRVLNLSVTTANESIDQMKAENTDLKKEIATLKDRVIDIQSRSMRNNSIFYGIEEHERLEEDQQVTLEEELQKFIKDKLCCEDEIFFERVHRLKGKVKLDNEGKKLPRPLIAKFLNFKQRE